MTEIDNPEIPAVHKEFCLDAVRILDEAMKRPGSNKDHEFLKTIEEGIFNPKVTIMRTREGKTEWWDYSASRTSVLLDKARILLGIPETADDRARKQNRKLEDIKRQINSLRGRIP
jgi:hypothetical protein